MFTYRLMVHNTYFLLLKQNNMSRSMIIV
ncbi:F14D16.6 [Arabidopsis thaliana]|uniref:F14D16.6 n=1 Tax=Arabidopsis thaliana TaxID=3702 RepID=Q9LMD6_ARATH|nr:F14D16.6 [Arabidopsis thaliana]